MVAMGWITWFLHGILQSILLWAPLVEPLQEEPIPNPWWEPCKIFDLWAFLLDADSRPTAEFMDLYWECLWSKFRGGIADQYNAAIAARVIPIWQTIGSLPEMVGSVVEWISLLAITIGETLPIWADDIVSGLTRLWELIPEPIRDGLQTWLEFLEAAPEAIQEWVRELIGSTIERVVELWDWFIGMGQTLTEWWQWAHDELNELLDDGYGWVARVLGEAWAFLDWFASDPTGALASWLSPWWEKLTTFASDCLDFWYNLWGEYAEDLAGFLGDPMEFLWNIGEDWLNERLERA